MIKDIKIEYVGQIVTVSFETDFESPLISSIAIKLGIDGLDYAVYIDDTGLVRSWTFIATEMGKTISASSMLNAAVSIEDSEGNIHIFKKQRCLANENGLPFVDNVRAIQRSDGSGVVDIWYDYLGTEEISPATVAIEASNDSGQTFSSLTFVQGDVGSGVATGVSRRIFWNAGIDIPNQYLVVVFKISLVDADGISAIGQRISGATIVDTTKPISYVMPKMRTESNPYALPTDEDIKNQSKVIEIIESSSSSSISSESSL